MNNSDKVYQELLKRSLLLINAQIKTLERKNHGLRALAEQTSIEINSLKIQYQQLATELKNYEERERFSEAEESKLDKLDMKATENLGKQQEHIARLNELEAVKKKLQTTGAIRKVNRQIEHQKELIQKLQKKSVKIDRNQRKIMLPKYKKMQKRNQLLSHQQAKVNWTAAKIKDNQELQSMLDPENSLKDLLASKIYDIKGQFYQKSLSHSQEVLETMKNQKSNIAIRGANVMTLSKKAMNKFRNQMASGRKESTELLDMLADKVTPSESQVEMLPLALPGK